MAGGSVKRQQTHERDRLLGSASAGPSMHVMCAALILPSARPLRRVTGGASIKRNMRAAPASGGSFFRNGFTALGRIEPLGESDHGGQQARANDRMLALEFS
jgi:hypothetical protein